MQVIRWIERLFALLAWLSVPAFIAWVSLQTHRSTSCLNTHCTTVTTSDWQQHPLYTLTVVAITLLLGLAVAGLIYAHSVTGSGGQLAVMWILVPVLALCVYGFAFTWMGTAAFYWGFFTLLAAIVGSVSQLLGRHDRANALT